MDGLYYMQMAPKWCPDGIHMAPKWCPDGMRMVLVWYADGTWMVLVWYGSIVWYIYDIKFFILQFKNFTSYTHGTNRSYGTRMVHIW